jgi:hypothetical protein
MPPTNELRVLASTIRGRRAATLDEIDAAEQALGFSMPEPYRDFVQLVDGGEGWAGEAYVSMWPVSELAALNAMARVADFAPHLTLFGTDGGTECLAFDRLGGGVTCAMVPIVGLGLGLEERRAATFDEFLTELAGGPVYHERHGAGLVPRWTRQPNPDLVGMNVWQIHPVILGGHPTEAANRTILPLRKMLEAAAFWNEQLAAISQGGPATGRI